MATETDTDVEELDLESSTESDITDADEAQSAEADADSSTATEEESDGDSLLSVMRDVLNERPAAEEAEAAGSQPDSDEAGKEAETSPSDMDPDTAQFKDVPFNAHPRFQQVLRERRAYKADAERYQNVQTFLEQNNLSGDEAADMLTIAGLMKTNPREAWERARPTIEKLMIAAGEILPQDLEARVQQGDIPADQAYELSALRAQTESQRRAAEWAAQQQQRYLQAQTASALQQTASMWEGERTATDPDFARKLPWIEREVSFLQAREGRPTTPEGVRDQLNRAHAAVTTQLRSLTPAPAKKAIKPVMGGQGKSSGAPKAKSVLDIVNQTVEARAG